MVLTFKSLSGLSHDLTLHPDMKPQYRPQCGPVNGFLACYFPVHRRYLIKPRGKIRPAIWTDLGGDEAMLRISLDSLSRDGKADEGAVKVQ